MGRYNFRAQRVHENVSGLLQAGRMDRKPAWFDVVGDIPTPELLTRTRPAQHSEQNVRHSGKRATRKASKMFQPVEIRYPEDTLRKTFFKDHPWELARPRIVTEEDGVNRTETWDAIRQRGRLLSGESVVQRQMHLMQQEGLSKSQAYDVARSEFYRERLREDVERRVAREEALHYGAHFGKSRLEIGAQLEDEAFEDWRVWADQEVTAAEQNRMAGSVSTDSTSDTDLPAIPEESDVVEGDPGTVGRR